MIPLIPRTCLRVSTTTTASASAGPLGLYCKYAISACFPLPYPLHFSCVSHLSAFLPLSLFCFIPGEILGANYRFCVACVTRCVLLRYLKGSRTRSSLPYQRTKDAAIGDGPLFGSDLRFSFDIPWVTGPFWLTSPVWSKTSRVCYSWCFASGDATRSVQFPA